MEWGSFTKGSTRGGPFAETAHILSSPQQAGARPAVSFGIRVGQDTREVDLANKSMVLFLVLQQTGMAVLWTARTEGLRWPDSYSLEWSEAILRAVEQFSGAFDACGGPLAFDHAGFIPLGYQGYGFVLGDRDRES